MSRIHYHHLLTMAGFKKKKCSSCSGNSKATYTRGDEQVIMYKLSKVFRYKVGKKYLSGGSNAVLHHQHFMQ